MSEDRKVEGQSYELEELWSKEGPRLRLWATIVTVWLVLLLLLSLAATVWLFVRGDERAIEMQEIALCVLGGTLGSSLAALRSLMERISDGWEFTGGQKYPSDERPHKFVARMIPYFLIRPFMGSVVGLVMYAGLLGGYLIAVSNAAEKDFSRHGLAFLAILAGLFAKTFIEKLNEIFKALVGKS